MRGALSDFLSNPGGTRIIPADAGSTEATHGQVIGSPDHPRGCGEHLAYGTSYAVGRGSSPRMRGARRSASPGIFRTGIIPADAGSTEQRSATPCSPQDHPRGCGEHMNALHDPARPRGSSPRMRGARLHQGPEHLHRGIIPADAGSTVWSSGACVRRADHPRGCGEHTVISGCALSSGGSSPRMRGALHVASGCKPLPGIIPADAGSTWWHLISKAGDTDHPRGCGEHHQATGLFQQLAGSSPRMRGAHIPGLIPANQTRIIPADAGSTPQQRSGKGRYKDHPRGCGEHSVIEDGVEMAQGSSPRMRGAPCIASVVPNDVWIIPADAGSTWADNAEIDVNEDHPRGCGEHPV